MCGQVPLKMPLNEDARACVHACPLGWHEQLGTS